MVRRGLARAAQGGEIPPVRICEAWHGRVWCGAVWYGGAGLGAAGRGWAWRGMAGLGMARAACGNEILAHADSTVLD
jgi:hypothetical protein